ncbi:MAG: hypothetical protein NTV10_03030 [Methanoregula sp.]|nr:hypothetical protein [Methanoregula sp.]
MAGGTKKIYILIKNIAVKRASSCNNMAELVELSSFINFLHKEIEFNFNLNSFDCRFRLQKFVFLAKFFGWHNDYSYGIYLRGPYSQDLAAHYYSFKKIDIRSVPTIELTTFDKKAFLNLIRNKEDLWLEAAATIISMMDSYKVHYKGDDLKTKVLERVIDLKDEIPRSVINTVYQDLSSAGIFSNIVKA